MLGVFGAAVASGPEAVEARSHARLRLAAASLASRFEVLSERARDLRDGMAELERSYAEDVAPLERELRNQSTDGNLVRRVAVALVREGRSAGVDPRLLLSVLLVEDPTLAFDAISTEGAVGLMQVMPAHAGAWGCDSDDLLDPDANICHGARILAHYMSASGGDLEVALLRYNGCVHGTNTPDCHLYPTKVYRRTSFAMVRAASR
jgi:soluble lytic murein transglycosylase-like protein